MQTLMKALGITPIKGHRRDVPDYLTVALRYYRKYEETGQPLALTHYHYYIEVAEEFGFCTVEDQVTVDDASVNTSQNQRI